MKHKFDAFSILFCISEHIRCMNNVEGYQNVVAALLSVERDICQTGVDVEAARLTAQKLAENGMKAETDRMESVIKEEVVENNTGDPEDGDERNEEGNEEGKDEVNKNENKPSKTETPRLDQTSLSDLEELLFCRSGNQIKVCTNISINLI